MTEQAGSLVLCADLTEPELYKYEDKWHLRFGSGITLLLTDDAALKLYDLSMKAWAEIIVKQAYAGVGANSAVQA